ncbi:MAG: glycosyltransferase family 2 protein, partial [Gemmatimonadetes bacterium]|nr:glycosyltransferase family 2 protein [Gemmatimonadota bacterium]
MNGVSIIVPLYNKERTVVSAIEKALGQSSSAFELIVVDDGSTDGSVAALAPFEDRIQLLTQENAGPSAARNAGARVARFPVLAFLDADDEIHEDFVRSHLAVRNAHSNVELSLNSFEVVRGGERERSELLRERAGSLADAHSGSSALLLHAFDARFVVNVHSGGYCIDKSLFERSGGFDEGLR